MKIFNLLVPLVLFGLTGCATIFHGSTQAVTINSVPEGASITVEGNLMGKTPATFNLKKNKYKNVTVKLDGYDASVVPLTTSYDAITILDIFWDCSTTDLVTGNAYEYEPNTYTVQLRKSSEEPKKN